MNTTALADISPAAPTFSIVTVTLNCAADAVRTAQSVLAQSYGSLEYIVKDGGSTDGTAERLRDVGVARVIVEPDRGVYHAMNQALAYCSGQYVCFLNAGDLFPAPDTLAIVAHEIGRSHEPALLYGDLRSYTWHPTMRAAGESREIRYPSRLSRFYLYRKMICHQTWFVRRELYLARGGLDERYPILADYAFLLQIAWDPDVRYTHIPAVTAVYQGGGVSEQRADQMAQERAAIHARVYHPLERMAYASAYRCMRLVAWGPLLRCIYYRLSDNARRLLNGW